MTPEEEFKRRLTSMFDRKPTFGQLLLSILQTAALAVIGLGLLLWSIRQIADVFR